MNNVAAQHIIQILIVILLALLIARLLGKAGDVVQRKGWLPAAMTIPFTGFIKWAVWITGCLIALELWGVPIKSLWTALLSVMLVVAVAFFASWSILSNILSAAILLTFSRARIGDTVELRDTKRDEVGIRGRIVDVNLFYVTIEELIVDESISAAPAMTQIPCHLFFFRVVRCWRGHTTQPLKDAFSEQESKEGRSSNVGEIPDSTKESRK